MQAVIYARYSSDSQRDESIDGQIRECMEYAKRNDIEVVGQYIDRALSARTADRPDFQRMIKDSDKKTFDLVLVWKLDRFSRDRYDSVYYKHTLKKNGVKVVSAKENISDGPEGIILESMLEGYAEFYSAELSQKIRRGQTDNALNARNNGGVTPLGYVIGADGTLEIDANTAPIVCEIFERFVNGETMINITRDLNARGVHNTIGKPFCKNSFSTLLRNRKYIGEYKYGNTIVRDGVPRIVSDALFEAAQRRFGSRQRMPAQKPTEYLLTAKLFCGKCGRMMIGESGTSHTGATHRYYKCQGAKKHLCDKQAVRKEEVEFGVARTAEQLLSNREIVNFILDRIMEIQMREDPMVPVLKKQLREVNNNLDNIVKAIESGVFTSTTKQRLIELEDRKSQLETALDELTVAHRIIPRDVLQKHFESYRFGDIKNKTYQKKLIDTFINTVYLYDDKVVIVFNYKGQTATLPLAEFEKMASDEGFDISTPCSTITCKSELFFFEGGFALTKKWPEG